MLHNTRHSRRVRELLRQTGVPVVETGNLPSDPPTWRELLQLRCGARHDPASRRLGYRRIGFVTLPARQRPLRASAVAATSRRSKELGLAPDPDLVLEAAGGFAEGGDALVRLIQTHPDLDA